MSRKIHIIGIGSDGLTGLTAHAREILESAQVLLGSEEDLEPVAELSAEKHPLGDDLPATVQILKRILAQEKRAVLVANGDPLFYGVARYLCDRVGKEHFEVHPHVSSMQLAFARVKESWEDAYLVSLATHPPESVLEKIRIAETVGLFTTEQHSPSRLAALLLAHGIDYFRAYVCENLGAPDERVTQGELRELAKMSFAPLNVVILKRKPDMPDRVSQADSPVRFGNPDEVFEQSKPKSGLLTQSEVRALALAKMRLHPGDVAWDVGAGSGAVAIEAAMLCNPGMVYAIERDVIDHQLISSNAETFGARNLRAVLGTAPGVFEDLPVPDAIFIGGTGRGVGGLIEQAYARLREGGRLVINVASLENLATAQHKLKALVAESSSKMDLLMINVARSTEQLGTFRFEAVNPTFLLTLTKRR